MTAVKGFYESSPSTVTTGKYKTIGITSDGAVRVSISGSATIAGTVTANDQAKYNSTPVTVVNGSYADLQSDVNGYLKVVEQYIPTSEDNTNGVIAMAQKPLATATYSPSLYTNFGAATKANIKASAGNVFSFSVTNLNAAARYLQLHNKASAPAATDVPLLTFYVPATTGAVIIGNDFFADAGLNFSTGVGFAISTTAATFTDSATANEHLVQVTYK